jgi:hypothetical protein
MFSELRHHPRFTYQMRNEHSLPTHVSQQEWLGRANYQREQLILHKM